MTTTPASPAGPPALPRRPGPVLAADLHAAWDDYRAAEAAETAAWEQLDAAPESHSSLAAAFAAAQAQTERAWRRYMQMALAFAKEAGTK